MQQFRKKFSERNQLVCEAEDVLSYKIIAHSMYVFDLVYNKFAIVFMYFCVS